MKRALTWLIFGIVMGWTIEMAHAFQNDLGAKKVIEEAWQNYRSARYEKETIWMIFIYNPHDDSYNVDEIEKMINQGGINVHKIIRYLEYNPQRNDKMIMWFEKPVPLSKIRILILRYPDKSDLIVHYSPALTGGQDRRSSPLDNDSFVGSNLVYGDIKSLMGEDLNPFLFSFDREQKIGREWCYAIVQRPNPNENVKTTYESRRLFRAKTGKHILRVEYFQNGLLTKIQSNSGIVYEKGVWRPTLVEMRLAQKKFTTVLYWPGQERKVDLDGKDLPTGVFTEAYLKRGGR